MTDDKGASASGDSGTRIDEDVPGAHALRADPAPDDTDATVTRPVREWAATRPAEPDHGSTAAAAGAVPAPTPVPAAPAGSSPTTVLPTDRRPQRPGAPREGRVGAAAPRAASRPPGRGRRARLVLQRVDPWSVFLFSLVASLCLGVVLLVAVAALYLALDVLGVLSSLNGVLGEVVGGAGEVGGAVFTVGRVLGATAVLAAVDVVLLTALATLSALLYNLCASLTGGIEVVLGERE